VLGLWRNERFYFNSARIALKVRNLATNAAVAVSAAGQDADIVVVGRARPVRDVGLLTDVAEAFPSKYEWWRPRVRDGEFVAEGDDVRIVFEVVPERAFAFGKRLGLTASRYDF
jgi:hypothetical protein